MRFATHFPFGYLVPAALTAAVAVFVSSAPQASAAPSPKGPAPASHDLRVYLINEAGAAPQTLEVAEAEAGEIWRPSACT